MNVTYIDHMGNDNSVVDSARVSFAKQAKNYTDEENTKLIQYLAKHKHEIPFAHTAITVRVEAPISIRTQCFKHKIGFVENECSRRYIKTTPKVFVPTFRTAPSKSMKQGSGEEITIVEPYSFDFIDGKKIKTEYSSYTQEDIQSMYRNVCNKAIDMYNLMVKPVNEGGLGIAPEQARFVLPQGALTEWIWTGSLLAFARFYKLRTDNHAQKEIRNLAYMVEDIIEPLFPISWRALTKGV